MKNKYSIGIDFGTNSVRTLLVDITDGKEICSSFADYSCGEKGIFLDPQNAHLARQEPSDYLKSMKNAVQQMMEKVNELEIDINNIIGIGVDATGSTPIPVSENLIALSTKDEFKDNLYAKAWLWKDHTSYKEAKEITELAQNIRPEYLSKCGGAYSSEWFFSKILNCLRNAPDVFNSAYSWVEFSDYIPAILSGITDVHQIKRNLCAAGHKAMYNKEWGGLPDVEFLNKLAPELGELRSRLFEDAYPSDTIAGYLSEEWQELFNLKKPVPIAVGALDAHIGAVGSGIGKNRLVKIIGTSSCDIMVHPKDEKLSDIPGVAGIADESVLPGFVGIEAGQSAVGDIFDWYVSKVINNSNAHNILTEKAEKLKAGQSGLLALDWNNGNRNILTDPNLSGLLLGQNLHTTDYEIYRALIEATAFGARRIIERLEEYGIKINEIVNCGGIAEKNPLVMQTYANVLNRPMAIAASSQTVALGAAIMGAAAVLKNNSEFENVEKIQSRVCKIKEKVFEPENREAETYNKLYELYLDLHDAFGIEGENKSLYKVMKELLKIKKNI